MSGEKERKKGGVSGEGVAKERERSVSEQREREESDWGERERRRRVSGEKERRNVIGEREGEC